MNAKKLSTEVQRKVLTPQDITDVLETTPMNPLGHFADPVEAFVHDLIHTLRTYNPFTFGDPAKLTDVELKLSASILHKELQKITVQLGWVRPPPPTKTHARSRRR